MENTTYHFCFEPSVNRDGSFHSWELLTKKVYNMDEINSQTNGFSFDKLSDGEKIKVFEKQLEVISNHDGFANDKSVSLNIDDLLSDCILNDRYISDFLLKNKKISFEINEFFHEFNGVSNFLELKALSSICPIWLDDFGSGYTNIELTRKIQFEYIKIDKDYFWKNQHNHLLSTMLSSMISEGNNIIIEGIETSEQRDYINTIGCMACQGRLWSEYYYYLSVN